jgi:hypothetical protein
MFKSVEANARMMRVCRIIAGGTVKGANIRSLMAAHVEPWPLSILIGKMVKGGVLEVVQGKELQGRGQTWMKTYRLTAKGRRLMAEVGDLIPVEAVDLKPMMQRAVDHPNKWVALPVGVGDDELAMLGRRGFTIKTVIRWDR